MGKKKSIQLRSCIIFGGGSRRPFLGSPRQSSLSGWAATTAAALCWQPPWQSPAGSAWGHGVVRPSEGGKYFRGELGFPPRSQIAPAVSLFRMALKSQEQTLRVCTSMAARCPAAAQCYHGWRLCRCSEPLEERFVPKARGRVCARKTSRACTGAVNLGTAAAPPSFGLSPAVTQGCQTARF